MRAVLRVWWTFFAAFRVQRILAIVGISMCALFVAVGVVAPQPFWMLGPAALFLFILFPAAVASAAIFRALSATHTHQLLPRFRVRMLYALGLLLSSVLVPFAVIGTAFEVASFVVGSAELARFAAIVGALLLRALAIRRWESIDWLRVRPIVGMAGALQ